MSRLIDAIKQEIGFPFGIRGTAKRYYKAEGTLPSGDSDTAGSPFGVKETAKHSYKAEGSANTLHFFVVDDGEIEKFGHELDTVFDRTVTKAIAEHALSHAAGEYVHFRSDGAYRDIDLPVLYIFFVGEVPYWKERYKGFFSRLGSKPTFAEADYTAIEQFFPELEIHPNGIFAIDYAYYQGIDAAVREHVKELIPELNVEVTSADKLRRKKAEDLVEIFEETDQVQTALLDILPEECRFTRPSLEQIRQGLNDPEQFAVLYDKACFMIGLYNQYMFEVYNRFAKKIIEDVKGRFTNR